MGNLGKEKLEENIRIREEEVNTPFHRNLADHMFPLFLLHCSLLLPLPSFFFILLGDLNMDN